MKGKNMSMDSKKVSLDLISGSKQVYNFISQLEKAAGHMNLNPQKYSGKKTSDPASSFEDKYIGYWLHIKQKKWIDQGNFTISKGPMKMYSSAFESRFTLDDFSDFSVLCHWFSPILFLKLRFSLRS